MEETVDNKEPIVKRIIGHVAFVPILLFLLVMLVFSFTSRFVDRPPQIQAISPEVGSPGDVLVVNGQYFGETRSGGEVLISGIRPVTSSYIEWSDTRISVRIPHEVGSGMIYVSTRNGKSNGVLFTNRNHIPIVLSGPAEPGAPYIEDVTPTKGEVGDLVTLSGLNFGFERGQNRVYFTPIAFTGENNRQIREDWFIACCECDFDYIQWSNTEITIKVPDGAASGNIFVHTDRGNSNTQFFEVPVKSGTKVLRTGRGYQVQQVVQVRVTEAEQGNGLYVWVPEVYLGIHQNNMERVKEPEPYWSDYLGVNVYFLSNIVSGERYTIQQTYWFDRYSVETKINEERVEGAYKRDGQLYKTFTEEDVYIPAESDLLDSIIRSAAGNERNPYRKAKRIFYWLLDFLSYEKIQGNQNIEQILEKGRGDSYSYAVLLTALLRHAGIPARPLGGFIVYDNKQTIKHYWSEFYLEGFGWIPMDPSLADGLTYGDFPRVENPVEYYFGNIDDGHILFSRGVIPAVPIRPDSNVLRREDSYSLQNFHEETFGNLFSYSSMWQNIRVMDWW